MKNIWEFLLQTLCLAETGALILLVQALFRDKLSPRWHYGIWSLFALRALLPANVQRFLIFPFSIAVEMLKTVCEKPLHSAYSSFAAAVSPKFGFPVLTAAPQSVTDILFAVYAAGVLLFLLYYAFSFLRLRACLKTAQKADNETLDKISDLCRKHGVRICKTVLTGDVPCAFTYGVFRPVLVLPSSSPTDEKVILHELMHLKYKDSLQNTLLYFLRALHWCNPFIHYLVRRIQNDLEALCDQRVLERLEGEERREYGNILLSMANNRYARVPGTDAVSNGGKNIAKRIAAIVRFKKYPKGMALASVCIAVILACFVIYGNAYALDSTRINYPTDTNTRYFLAASRLCKPKTPDSAINLFAKAVAENNGLYAAFCTPEEHYEELYACIDEHGYYNYNTIFHQETLYGYDDAQDDFSFTGKFHVYNIKETAQNEYSAVLLFDLYHTVYNDWIDPSQQNVSLTMRMPISVKLENGRWTAQKTADGKIQPVPPDCDELYMEKYTYPLQSGTVTLYYQTVYDFSAEEGRTRIDLNKKFYSGLLSHEYVYDISTNSLDRAPEKTVALLVTEDIDSEEPAEENPNLSETGESSWSSSDGSSGGQTSTDFWDGTVTVGGGTGFSDTDSDKIITDIPREHKITVLWDGEVVEEVIADENGTHAVKKEN